MLRGPHGALDQTQNALQSFELFPQPHGSAIQNLMFYGTGCGYVVKHIQAYGLVLQEANGVGLG